MEKWEAPWTLQQVKFLAMYQADGIFHPYTCPNDRKDLIPTRKGWICGKCDYKQTWAWPIEGEILEWTEKLWNDYGVKPTRVTEKEA